MVLFCIEDKTLSVVKYSSDDWRNKMKAVNFSMPKQIADNIEQKIKDGVLNVGDKLPTEPELVIEYGASRNTVREAVQSLIHAGILQAKQGNGTYVIAKDRLQVDLFSLMSKTQKEDTIEVRTLLEEHIVESAILHVTDLDIQKIKEALNLRNADFEKIKEYTKADIDFHIAIAYATHNVLLIKMYQYISQYFIEYIACSQKKHENEQEYIDSLHIQLAESIIQKDICAAKKVIIEIINL